MREALSALQWAARTKHTVPDATRGGRGDGEGTGAGWRRRGATWESGVVCWLRPFPRGRGRTIYKCSSRPERSFSQRVCRQNTGERRVWLPRAWAPGGSGPRWRSRESSPPLLAGIPGPEFRAERRGLGVGSWGPGRFLRAPPRLVLESRPRSGRRVRFPAASPSPRASPKRPGAEAATGLAVVVADARSVGGRRLDVGASRGGRSGPGLPGAHGRLGGPREPGPRSGPGPGGGGGVRESGPRGSAPRPGGQTDPPGRHQLRARKDGRSRGRAAGGSKWRTRRAGAGG